MFIKKAPPIIIISLFYFLPGVLYSQVDSMYIKSYYNKIVPRVLYNFKRHDINFVTSNEDSLLSKDAFSTGNQKFLGGDLSYKWATIGYNLGLNPNNSKRNMDFRFSTAYRPLQLQFNVSYLQNLNYLFLKYDAQEEEDTLLITKENQIRIITSKLKLDYVFNYKKYCSSATFSQGGKQILSQGSFIASAALCYDQIHLSNLSLQVKEKFDSLNAFDNVVISGFDVGIGYGYNFVIKKNWTVSLVEIPKISFRVIDLNKYEMPSTDYFTVGFTNHVKAGILYTNNNFFIGTSFYNLISTNKVTGQWYKNVYTSLNIFTGWIVDTEKLFGK